MIACRKQIVALCMLTWCSITVFVTTAFCQNRQPLQLVEKVADKIIADTHFEFKLVPQTQQLGIQVIDFRFMKMDEGQAAYAMCSATAVSDTTVRIGITAAGKVELWLNKKKVYQQPDMPATYLRETAYDRFHFTQTFAAKIKKGENQFFIRYEANNAAPVVFLRPVTYADDLDKSIQFNKNALQSCWNYAGPFTAANTVTPGNLQSFYALEKGKFINWQNGPQFFLPELVTDSSAAYQRDPYADWHYAHGIMVWSIIHLAHAANFDSYNTFAKKYAGFITQHLEYFRWQYDSLFAFRGSYHRIFRLTMLDDAGAAALPFTALFIKGHDTAFKKIIDTVIEYVAKKQVRLPDGTFCRPEPVEYTVWADDLFMSVPLLLQAAAITGDKKLYDDAAKQAINFHKYLFDAEAGLYKHGWFNNTGKQSAVCWGRANGWIAWATVELLSVLPKQHPLYKQIENNFRLHMKNLIRYQADDGMWHQVINNAASYEETSCTAMFTLALARGISNGWLDKKYKTYALKGWNAVAAHITPEGVVQGICRGTEIGADDEFYMNRKTIDNDPRGLGAVITAGIEISKLR